MENKKFNYTEKLKSDLITDTYQTFGACKERNDIYKLDFSKEELMDFCIMAYNGSRTILDIPVKSNLTSRSIPEEKRLTKLIPLINKLLKNFYSYCSFEDIKRKTCSTNLKETSLFDITKILNFNHITENDKKIFPYSVLLFNKVKQYYECYSKLCSFHHTKFEFEDRIIELANKFNIAIPEEESESNLTSCYSTIFSSNNSKDKKGKIEKLIEKLLSLPNFQLSFEEKREINQYSAIISQKIYCNYFVCCNSFDKHRITDIFDLKEIDCELHKLNKKEFCQKEYFKIAFKHVLNSCEKIGIILKKYDLDDFYIDILSGLTLFQYDNLENWEDKITHILRCDDCHNQVKHDCDNYLTSNVRSQEATFKCPNCGRTYTYSELVRIYEKNCHNSYSKQERLIQTIKIGGR